MVAYSFQKRFVAPIRNGEKRQTIRVCGRRVHAMPGDKLQLYCSMRSKHCEKIAEAMCIAVQRVEIVPHGNLMIKIENGQWLNPDEFDDFARADGFESMIDMQSFWLTHNGCTTFHGVIIHWNQITPP